MVTVTVFTPTYNRAYCLHKGYEALRRQTKKDFIWLVIDDGSTDNTKELISKWKHATDNGFEIEYIHKENGGLYTGYNTAIEATKTELCVCVDSDDYLLDDAIEKIVSFWREYGDKRFAGIVGLDCFENGEIVGDPLPNQKTINLIDLAIGKYKLQNGDRKNIVRTELYKAVAPMKVFPEERDFNPHYMHLQISQGYDFLVFNERLCVVEYLPDGMTNSVFKSYVRSPKGYRESRLLELSFKNAPLKYKVKKTLHYISSCILSKQPCISASPRKFLTVCLYPFGWLFSIYVRKKAKRGK